MSENLSVRVFSFIKLMCRLEWFSHFYSVLFFPFSYLFNKVSGYTYRFLAVNECGN